MNEESPPTKQEEKKVFNEPTQNNDLADQEFDEPSSGFTLAHKNLGENEQNTNNTGSETKKRTLSDVALPD